MHALLDDDLGRLTVRRLRPWHRLLARGLATRLDRQLAAGVRPEANPILAARAGSLAAQGPVPARGVAMVSQLLADGGGALYRTACRDDLNAIIERASQALIR